MVGNVAVQSYVEVVDAAVGEKVVVEKRKCAKRRTANGWHLNRSSSYSRRD